MHDFLTLHHDELIARCKAKVALRPRRHATEEQLKNGVPLFLAQLTRTLEAERLDESEESLRISGASGGDTGTFSEIGHSASAHGKVLLSLGFTVDQVVHDYGDLCQAITELAEEMKVPFAVEEFRTLNRCLDNAIAEAVTAFSVQRDNAMASQLSSQANERLGFLVHELRNSLQIANLSVRAMELGGLTFTGATGSVLKRSLASMRALIDVSLAEVREHNDSPLPTSIFSLATFVDDASTAAQLEAEATGCALLVGPVDPVLRVEAHRDLLLGALGNLLKNAFKFTHRNTAVSLNAYAIDNSVHIDVEDRCGGLSPGFAEAMFSPFVQLSADKTGLGLGLTIARRNIESMGGTLNVRNLKDIGCVFTIQLPLSKVDRRQAWAQRPDHQFPSET